KPALPIPSTQYSILNIHNTIKDFGRPSAGAPPLPIPNREVKPCRADGTGVTPGRVGRRPIPYSPYAFRRAGFFVVSSSKTLVSRLSNRAFETVLVDLTG